MPVVDDGSCGTAAESTECLRSGTGSPVSPFAFGSAADVLLEALNPGPPPQLRNGKHAEPHTARVRQAVLVSAVRSGPACSTACDTGDLRAPPRVTQIAWLKVGAAPRRPGTEIRERGESASELTDSPSPSSGSGTSCASARPSASNAGQRLARVIPHFCRQLPVATELSLDSDETIETRHTQRSETPRRE